MQACIHCGLCLEFCPTYLVTHEEMSSPRGRIYLMKAVNDGTLAITDPIVQEHELSCLVCRSCETACPSGVQYSVLMEHTRDEISKTGSRGALHRFVYTKLLGSNALTSMAQVALALMTRTGILSIAKRLIGSKGRMAASLRVTPETIPFPSTRPNAYPAKGKRIGSVGLLIGCIGDVFTKPVNDATITVLTTLGYDVLTIPEITCCGSLAEHAGYPDRTTHLATIALEAIEEAHVDYFITNIAGCGAMMKDYATLLHREADATIAKIKDISEFLYAHHADDLRALGLAFEQPTRIAYHAPCHLYHGQKIVDTPAKLLRLIVNAEVTLLEENDICCGSAGTYNIERPEMAAELLTRKMGLIESNGSEIVATANAGCLMQLRSGVEASDKSTQVFHSIEIIAALIRP